MAVSNHPMFSVEDKLTTPLKDGLWVADDPDCPVDTNLPRSRWPNCAFWLVLRGNQLMDIAGDKKGIRPVGLFVASGQPPIAQVENLEKDSRGYFFYGFEPAGTEPDGTITAVELWAVACGTPRIPGSTREIDPYPGIDKDCQPQSKAALRAAAVASRASQEKLGRMKWIRPSTTR
jgi:hypothetical protein